MMWKAVVLLLLALFGDFVRSSYAPHPKTKTADHHHHQQTDHDGAKKTRHLAKDHDLGKVFSDIIGGLSGLSARFELSGSLDHDRSQSLDAHLVVKKKMEAAKDKTVLADSGLEAVALQVPVVEESDILLEEVMGSVEGKVGGGLFDSHLEGKVGGGLHLEGEVVGGQLDISLEGTVGGEEEGKRVKRQVEQADIREALCRDKNPGEFFRLVAGATNCRDVVACSEGGLQAIRCPPGLAFSLKKQTCEWRRAVTDCGTKSLPKLALPLLYTSEPLCNRGELACGDGLCLAQDLFCDEKVDCADGSDENLCGPDDPNRAAECRASCKLPDCFCSLSGQSIPGSLLPEDTPQMIMLTFDDGVNVNNWEILDTVLNNKLKNPNGCDAKATFFLSHKFTNYSMVQELYRRGHEIASHSISHDSREDYWEEGSKETWQEEIGGAKDITAIWANIPENEIVGSRAPLLRLGGNRQFSALQEEGFKYDSTMVAPLSNPPYWPYSLEYSSPHRCYGNFQDCPSRSHKVMEMVMNEFDPREEPGTYDEQVSGCVMLDSCSSINSPDVLYNVLTHNFIRHYEQNRAPMGLFLHAAWLKKSPEMQDALQFWMDEILATYTDVYLVTMKQVMSWMEAPVPSSEALTLPAWREKCTSEDLEPSSCSTSTDCALPSPAHSGQKLRLQTCNSCPRSYPWLGDSRGQGGGLGEVEQ